MIPKRRKQFLLLAAAFLALSAAIAAISACLFLRIFRPAHLAGYLEMAFTAHPVWREFASRRVHPGDSAAELLRRFPPQITEEFGRYGVYTYFRESTHPAALNLDAFCVSTRDGKLLRAISASCTWQYTFFDLPDTDLDREYTDFSDLHLCERYERDGLKSFVSP